MEYKSKTKPKMKTVKVSFVRSDGTVGAVKAKKKVTQGKAGCRKAWGPGSKRANPKMLEQCMSKCK